MEELIFVKPRLTDFHGIDILQEAAEFAIPFIDEDLPLYVDPFLMWKSPSHQDTSLHIGLIQAFNSIINSANEQDAIDKLIMISECNEVGLGGSSTKKGVRIGPKVAKNIVDICKLSKREFSRDIKHLEEVQLTTDQISKDRISDFACNLVKSFLIDFTISQCDQFDIPRSSAIVKGVYNLRDGKFYDVKADLPINPLTNEPILFVPKRWLRFTPWINYDDYYDHHYLKSVLEEGKDPPERFDVLNYNRDNYDQVIQYIEKKEREYDDCKNDPLFKSIPLGSAKKAFSQVKKLDSGKDDGADKKYEFLICKLLPSLLYPHLDFAEAQSRTESGVHIRDLIFYNNKSSPCLEEFWSKYNSRQIVFEIKNVKELNRDHVNQLNRYMKASFGSFGVLVTRHEPPKSVRQNLIDLWSGQRRCILVLTDEDIELMVTVFESKQREPIDVLNKKYVEFMRLCPS